MYRKLLAYTAQSRAFYGIAPPWLLTFLLIHNIVLWVLYLAAILHIKTNKQKSPQQSRSYFVFYTPWCIKLLMLRLFKRSSLEKTNKSSQAEVIVPSAAISKLCARVRRSLKRTFCCNKFMVEKFGVFEYLVKQFGCIYWVLETKTRWCARTWLCCCKLAYLR